ncbi:MAG: phenylacetate--CoA ligase [Clostridiales bacterium]|nr:phenylacetate--CoA ligase [Clostridiales bacterium]
MAEQYWQKELETAPRAELEALQLKRLKETVEREYAKVPIYRERMDSTGVRPEDIKTLDDIRRLPFTVKQDLRDTYPYGMFACDMKDVVRLHASSGTTGKQIVVGYTANDLSVWANLIARQLTAAGIGKDDFMQVAFGYGLFTGGLGLHDGAQLVGTTVIPISTGNTARQLTVLKDFGATAICCTPSYAMYLAESAEAAGIVGDLKLRAGIFGAEPWTEEMRRQIEAKFHIKAYDIYGLTEVMGPGVSYECSCQKGMHVNEDHFIVEIIDPDTCEPVPDGEYGEIVYTSLTKEAFPVIRYRTRDIGMITREPCACGRTFARMSKPRGRTDDMLIIRGVNVFPSQIETVLINLGYAPNYQIIVDRVNNLDTFEVRVEISDENFDDSVAALAAREKKITEAMRSLLGIGPKITLVNPRSIARSEGKAKRVIDLRKLTD